MKKKVSLAAQVRKARAELARLNQRIGESHAEVHRLENLKIRFSMEINVLKAERKEFSEAAEKRLQKERAELKWFEDLRNAARLQPSSRKMVHLQARMARYAVRVADMKKTLKGLHYMIQKCLDGRARR
jgi:chromosome segregation ATPase